MGFGQMPGRAANTTSNIKDIAASSQAGFLQQ